MTELNEFKDLMHPMGQPLQGTDKLKKMATSLKH